MLLKLIVCHVPDANRARFSRGQNEWSALQGVEGFRGQVGGWNEKDPLEAVIVGLWRDEPAYARFMLEAHDLVFENNGQKGSYDASSVSLWDRLFDIPGSVTAMPPAIDGAGFARIAYCVVRRDRVEHFIEVQQRIWNPGMAGAGGMLAGAFSRSREDQRRFLVCTLWRSAVDHRAYVDDVFPYLPRRAEFERDCESLTGYVVPLLPTWTVRSSCLEEAV